MGLYPICTFARAHALLVVSCRVVSPRPPSSFVFVFKQGLRLDLESS